MAQRVWPRPIVPRAGCFLQLGARSSIAAGRLGDRELAVVDRHDAAAVVAAIFEPAQPFDQKIDRLLRTDVADNAAHRIRPANAENVA